MHSHTVRFQNRRSVEALQALRQQPGHTKKGYYIQWNVVMISGRWHNSGVSNHTSYLVGMGQQMRMHAG